MISAMVFCGLEKNSPHSGVIRLERVLQIVCDCLEVDFEETKLLYKSRKKENVFARHLYAHFCRKYTRESLENIAEYIKKNHTTIIHSDRAISDWISTDKIVKSVCIKIDKKIKKELSKIESNIDDEIINNIIKKYENGEAKNKFSRK
jgi:chromosomal replication initiation ATPase DnaA